MADVADVLAGVVAPSGRVLVVDELGGPHATSTAELLAARGCAVEVVTGALVAAQRLGPTLDRGPGTAGPRRPGSCRPWSGCRSPCGTAWSRCCTT